jgi:hypothetical protein
VTRTIAGSLMALVLLLLLAASITGASVATVGPVEASICLDESGSGHAQHIDVLIEPLSSPVVGVTSAARCLGVPALVPKVRPQTRGVLRL